MKKIIIFFSILITSKAFCQTETDLDGKIKSFFDQAPNCFASMKDSLLRSEGTTLHFNTKTTFFGKKGEVQDSKYECQVRYGIAIYLQDDGLAKANKIYEQIKSSLKKMLAGKIQFDTEKQTTYDASTYMIRGTDAGSKDLTDTKNIIELSIKRDKDWPAVYISVERKRY